MYLALACVTIGAGLASRRYPSVFPEWIARYGGDTLWAVVVFWLFALMRRRAGTLSIAATAMTFAVAVEVSQLYHARWVDAIRDTGFGSLILGSGFLWSDLMCYAIGVGCAAAVDAVLAVRRVRSKDVVG